MAKLEITIGALVGSSPEYDNALTQEVLNYFYNRFSGRSSFPGIEVTNQVKVNYVCERLALMLNQHAKQQYDKEVVEQAIVDGEAGKPGIE